MQKLQSATSAVMRTKISRKLEKSGDITEDDLRRNGEEIQKMTDTHIEKIDSIAKEKENEIMEI